jgi:hypothetical protein
MIHSPMTRLLCMRLGAGPSSAILESLHTVRRVAPVSGEHLVPDSPPPSPLLQTGCLEAIKGSLRVDSRHIYVKSHRSDQPLRSISR